MNQVGANPRFTWLKYKDKNQADAMNFAILNSKSTWIGWLNADEYYLDNGLSGVLDTINACPQIDIIYGDAIFCDENRRFIRLKSSHRYSDNVLKNFGAYISTCSFFVKREILQKVGYPYLDTNLRTSLDWDLFIRLFGKSERVAYLPLPIGVYRVHKSTLTNQRSLEEKHHEIQYIERRNGFIKSRFLGKYHHRLLKVLDRSYIREILAFLKYRKSII
jgi:GT2 family glycosyltransferase